MIFFSLRIPVMLMMQFMAVMGMTLTAAGCGYACTACCLFWFKAKTAFLCLLFEKFISQVELAHGGRAQSYSYDRPSSFSNGRRGGVSRRSEFRGLYFCLVNELINMSGLEFSFFFSCCEPHSYGWWFTFVSVMARSQGTRIVHDFCLYILSLMSIEFGWRCLFFFIYLHCLSYLFRTICDGLAMSVFLMYTARAEVSDNASNYIDIIAVCALEIWGANCSAQLPEL